MAGSTHWVIAVAVVLLCTVLLPSTIQAKPYPTNCDRYTDKATRATCQQLYDSLFHSLAYAYAAGTADPAATAAEGATPQATSAAINTAAPSVAMTPGQPDNLSNTAAVAGSIARAGRRSRYDGDGDGPEHREPRHYHGPDHDGPSYREHEEEPYSSLHHTADDTGEGPYHREPYDSGSQGRYPQPDPTVPLYPEYSVRADVTVLPKEGQETITGELTGQNFSSWSAYVGRDVFLRVSEPVGPDYFSNPSLQISQGFPAKPPARFNFVGPVNDPAAFALHSKMSAASFAGVTVIFGREGKDFPWRSALDSQLSIPQPSTCQYRVEDNHFGTQFDGQVPAAHSPAAFEGTPVELLLDALLGTPTEDVDFDLSCTSLQKQDNGGGLPAKPSPGTLSPDKFEWIKPKGHSARIAGLREDMFLAHWQHNDDKSVEYAQHSSWHHQLGRDDESTGNRHYEYSRRSDDGSDDDRHHHDASYAPAQPPQSSSLKAYDDAYLYIRLSPNNVNQNGSFTQPASTNWEATLDEYVLLEGIDTNVPNRPVLYTSQTTTNAKDASAQVDVDGTILNPTSITLTTKMTCAYSFFGNSPKYPWSDPLVITVPTKPTPCFIGLVQPDGSYVGLQGTVTAIETDPAEAYGFRGTSLELIRAVLAPEPRGVQDVKVTCGNFASARSTTKFPKPSITRPSS